MSTRLSLPRLLLASVLAAALPIALISLLRSDPERRLPVGQEALAAELGLLHAEIWDHVELGNTGLYSMYDVLYGPALHTPGEAAHSGGMTLVAPAGTPATPGVFSVALAPDRSRLGLATTDGRVCVFLAASEGEVGMPEVLPDPDRCVATGFDPALDAAGDGWPLRAQLSGRSLTATWTPLQGASFHRLVCAIGADAVAASTEDPDLSSLTVTIPAPGEWLCQLEAHPRSEPVLSAPLRVAVP